MALTEQVQLDIQNAQRQIDALEQQLQGLSTPVNVPVSVSGEEKLAQIRQELGLSENAAGGLNRELDDTEEALRDAGRTAGRTGDDIERAGRKGEGSFRKLSASVVGLVAAFGAVQAGRAFLSFAGEAIDAASDLEESTGKAQVVFGEFFDDIEAFAATAPQALGLANQEALEFTGTFGNLFTALGLSQQAAAELAPQIVQLGGDLASFNNLEVSEALDKLRAGLVGEAEPLRALGVNLNAAAVEAKALELGLAGASGEIDDAAKVQARYALILEQTTNAQGDFERTSDSIANQQKTLAAEFDGVRVAIGEALIPAFQNLLDIAPALIGAIEEGIVPAIATLSSGLGDIDVNPLVQVLGNLPAAGERISGVIGSGAQAIGNFGQAAGNLITLNIPGAIEQIGQAFDDISDARVANQVGQSIQDLITTIQSGTEPIAAFEGVLLGLIDADLPEDTFEDLVERLIAIAGFGPEDAAGLRALGDQIRDSGADAGFLTTEVDILLERLRVLETRGTTQSASEFFGNIAQAATEIPEPVRGASDAIGQFQNAMGRLDFEDDVDRVEAQFNRLPDGLDAAAAALRDDENEIVTDFTDFLNQLDDEIASRQAFRENLQLLESFGLDQLAEVFRTEGLDAAAALADAVANPEEARRAEELLDAEARTIAQSFRDELAAAIIGDTLDLTIPVNITAAIQSLILAGIPGQDAAGIVGGRGGGPNVGGGVTTNPTVVQNFNGPTPSTPDLARANQAINTIVN